MSTVRNAYLAGKSLTEWDDNISRVPQQVSSLKDTLIRIDGLYEQFKAVATAEQQTAEIPNSIAKAMQNWAASEPNLVAALKLVAKMIPVDPADPSAGVHTLNSLLESMKEDE